MFELPMQCCDPSGNKCPACMTSDELSSFESRKRYGYIVLSELTQLEVETVRRAQLKCYLDAGEIMAQLDALNGKQSFRNLSPKLEDYQNIGNVIWSREEHYGASSPRFKPASGEGPMHSAQSLEQGAAGLNAAAESKPDGKVSIAKGPERSLWSRIVGGFKRRFA